MASDIAPRDVTAVLPYYGTVSWSPAELDAKAAEWTREHAPVGQPWLMPFFKKNDTRRCAECPRNIFWTNCQFAAWAHSWYVSRNSRVVSPSLAQLRGTATS